MQTPSLVKCLDSRLLAPLLLAAACFSTGCSHVTNGGAPSVTWISTTADQPWRELPATIVAVATSPDADTVLVDPSRKFQPITGFGGCFNELGWTALTAVNATVREEALKALFDPATGCGFANCRVGLGANDFALDWYSEDETPGDFAMERFSIDRDRQNLIPFIKGAMKYQPAIAVWAVPWSPPSWMKTNGLYYGGRMKQDPQTLAAYALYFSKFAQAYQQEGINLYAIHPQNEPTYNDSKYKYPQCQWSGAELDTFIRDYLAPQLKKDKVNVQLWFGTIVSANLAQFVDPVLGDPATNPSIAGIGYQYGGQPAFAATAEKYPGKLLMQTETECYNGDDTWAQGFTTFGKICQDLNNSANGYDFWNLILSEKKTSSWGWRQNSLLTVDSQAQKVIYSPEFFALKHFSHFLPAGSFRVSASGGPLRNLTAFLNDRGEVVVVFDNDTDQDVTVTIQPGNFGAQFKVPAKSMNTAVFRGW